MNAAARRPIPPVAPLLLILAFAVARPVLAAERGPDEKMIAAGQRVFRWKCSICHSLDENRTGPRLRDVVGRPAGSVADYRYSPALVRAGLVWSEARLDRWLSGPARFIPGVRMDAQVPDPADRLAVIAYLRAMAAARD